MTTRVAVAAPNLAAAQAGLRVAAEGGGAVDAAVAAALVTMVTEPGIVSLAGGAYVSVWPAGAEAAVTVDGQVAMPGRSRPPGRPVDLREIRTEYGAGVTMTVGPGSVAVPGALAALDLSQQRFGRLPWGEVVQPAQEAARSGFPLGSAAAYYLPFVRDSVFAWDAETVRSIRRADGSWLEAGDRMVLPGLDETVRQLAEEGARALRDGDLATRFAADMAERGGLVTAADLADYRAMERPALAVRSGAWDLRTNPPPSIGGPVLAAMLHLLGEHVERGRTPDAGLMVAVQRQVLAARHERLDLATGSSGRAAAAVALLDELGWVGTGSPSTAHVSAVDADGGACAITTSYGYGSGATLPGTGLWLNNCLGEHELNRGLQPLQPGDRLASNMAPTVGRRRDGAVLALGSPGADRITTALAQVLVALGQGAGLQEAVDRPRLHVHLEGDVVRIEAEDDLALTDADLTVTPDSPVGDTARSGSGSGNGSGQDSGRGSGQALPVHRHHRQSMYFGGVGAALRLNDVELEAAADPRRAGAALISP